jgi:hypothetical protein
MNTLLKIQKVSLLSIAALGLLITSSAPCFAGQWQRNHPRRTQVLHRNNNINNRVNADKGQLGGHYNQLKREDHGIRNQEQRDARMNGGHITKGEQNQLNREENHVNQQVRRDHY